MSAEYADRLADVLTRHKLLIISDEVYEALTFHGKNHYSLAECTRLADRLVVVNSLSKTFSMTGWRIGSLFGPPQFMSHVFRMQESIISCLPVFIQKAALAAINGSSEQTEMMAQAFENRMKILAHGLNSIKGFSCRETDGGLCMMVNIKAFKKTSLAFSLELLEQAGVMTVPGSAFGTMGEGYVRFCYANSEQNIREAVKRISQYIGTKYA
jgi:aminotransferase